MDKKTLIIYAHPDKEGHCGYYLKKVIETLKQKKVNYKLIDLYQIKYNPILKEVRLAQETKKLEEETKRFQKDIFESSNLIFIYPTWWQNVPAILKGFIDRVFTSGFAFKYHGNMPKGLLNGKTAVVLTSTGGPAWYSKLIKRSRSIKVVSKDTLEFCGIKTRGYIVGDARALTENQRIKIDKNVRKAMAYLLN